MNNIRINTIVQETVKCKRLQNIKNILCITVLIQ